MSNSTNQKQFGPGSRHRNHGPAEKAKDAKGTFFRLLGYLHGHVVYLIAALLCIVIYTLCSLFGTQMIGIAIDDYISVGNFSGLQFICAGLIGIYVLASLFSWIQSRVMLKLAQDVVAQLREEIFEKFQSLPLKYFDNTTTGELMSRVTNDVDNISNALNSSVSQLLQGFLTIIGIMVMMFAMNVPLTIVTLCSVPVMLLATKAITKRSRNYFLAKQQRLGELNGYIEEIISGIKVVKVFSREENALKDFDDKNNNLLQVSVRAELYAGMVGPIMTAINNATYAVVVAAGAILMVTTGSVTLGMISNFTIYAKQFTRPFNELANQINTIMSALAGAERVFQVLDAEDEPEEKTDVVTLTSVEGDVVLQDVNFSYEAGHPILKHINLYAKPGQTIAFVGPTGAGKTTIINLLTRFYDIDSGKITIDGYDIYDIKRENLRKTLGIVLQDTYLFTSSIRENIRYGRLDATDEEIKAAAKLANAHEFIRRLPDGYDTELTDGGSNLSQGQRQMISIARAILADPSILILDEATSSVDTRTEVKIQQAMQNLMKGRTNFVIAHRLSTIKDADLIAVINHGEIIERGNHEELLAKKGFYYNLYTSQFKEEIV